MDNISLEMKNGGTIIYPLERIRTPRAALALIFEGLHRGARRQELIKAMQFFEKHLGIELGAVVLPSKRHDRARKRGY